VRDLSYNPPEPSFPRFCGFSTKITPCGAPTLISLFPRGQQDELLLVTSDGPAIKFNRLRYSRGGYSSRCAPFIL
jgi:hypothetical protein